ncbi:ribonuclease H-like protein [Colletotrichum zoysiae]|uniref:ribonuclease H n=1 Tax=Colletotrichum zoysiae TaxID=1216348 RepID=A0AAD9HL04_9PEZI|nr:ribonuclease H-like protein [Colletotrichum zoysiae]
MMGYDDDDGEGSRLFEHHTSDAHRMVPRSKLVVYDPQKQVFGLRMYSWSNKGLAPDPGSLVVYIDGACRDAGTPSARGSFAVYFGPGSRHNRRGLLAPALPQTCARAEIEALAQALSALREVTARDRSLTNIKIATGSEYLANAMSLWIGDWIENEGTNARGHRVAHFETLRELHEQLDDMTYGDDGGLEVMFWSIPRGENQEAERLANEAFQ